ncbi:MAG TPA: HNH endonuclease [Gemmatimonadaceae bacterium]|nr:HNH endonuclease [Gemmatimonadaceae bacterium]
MPTPVSIAARSSSITNSFINAIIPAVVPTEAEVLEALGVLGIDPENVCCAYCGDGATEWDHLRPLVVKQKPTGYISEIGNLIPACGRCNQSKGNKSWRSWIESNAPRSPKRRGIPNLADRIAHIEAYERWREPVPLDFASVIEPDIWAKHWENWERVLAEMRESQKLAAKIRVQLKSWHST